VIAKRTDDSLIAEGWTWDKRCRVTSDNGVCDHRQAWHRRTDRKEAESPVGSANGVRGDHSCLKGGAAGADAGAKRFEIFGSSSPTSRTSSSWG
jgi:hypothetical protein